MPGFRNFTGTHYFKRKLPVYSGLVDPKLSKAHAVIFFFYPIFFISGYHFWMKSYNVVEELPYFQNQKREMMVTKMAYENMLRSFNDPDNDVLDFYSQF